MNTLSRDDLRLLAAERGAACVSIYLPTHATGADAQQDPIRFRNLLKTAEEQLVQRGLRAADARALLDPAAHLVGDSAFWRHQANGLAVFVTAGALRTYRLPLEPEPVAVVNDRLHLKPIMPMFAAAGRFFILALSQNDVRLIEATAQHASEVALPGMPRSLEEALRYDEVEKQTQLRSLNTFGGGPRGPTVGHGHEIDEKDRIRRFLLQVSHGIEPHLRDEQAPLVLAAVEYVMSIFREVNSYPHLLDDGIVGNPDLVGADDLRDRALPHVTPVFAQARADALARYLDLAGTGGTASSVEEAVRAAVEGRVDTLFVARGKHLWGTFDVLTLQVIPHAAQEPGDEDLLDLAAVETVLKGGTVYTVDSGDIPTDSAVVAVLRY